MATTDNPLAGLRPDEVAAAWSSRGLDRITDTSLLAAVAELLTTPRAEPADSFSLHAPLEVMARAELLSRVSPAVREPARQRLAEVACTWATTGTPIDAPDTSEIEHPRERLAAGLGAGDPNEVDRAFVALCMERDQDEIVGEVADLVLPLLGGAGHGAIFLELLPRFRPAGGRASLMARTLLRDLAAHPDWRLTWFDSERPEPAGSPSEASALLRERLRAPRADRTLPNNFIHPTMSLVEEIGLAGDLLADATLGLPIDVARRDLLRIAAASMLQDEPGNAPYGWSHCLTMPQAALAIAHRASDTQLAIDVAATYVLGFRTTQSSATIDLDWEPDRPLSHLIGRIVEASADTAAASAWHADPAQLEDIVQQLVDHAARHRDAHLAKYTLACLDARAVDPAGARLFVAAACYLGAWWHEHDRAS